VSDRWIGDFDDIGKAKAVGTKALKLGQKGKKVAPEPKLRVRAGGHRASRTVGAITVEGGGFAKKAPTPRAPSKWASTRVMTPDELAEWAGELSAANPGRPCVDRPATPQEMEAGRQLAIELRERYHVRKTLIVAAEAGCITELRCGMPECFAPDRRQFEHLTHPPGAWAPTLEHFPLAKRFKGRREATNAVLAQRRCNNVGYKLEELKAHLEAFRLEDGSGFDPEAIDAAIADNVEQRRTAEGCYPRKSGSRRRAVRIAHEKNESLGHSHREDSAPEARPE